MPFDPTPRRYFLIWYVIPFDLTVEQEVAVFDVTVDDVNLMNMVDGRQERKQIELDFGHRQILYVILGY